jgi:hypothetical protein
MISYSKLKGQPRGGWARNLDSFALPTRFVPLDLFVLDNFWMTLKIPGSPQPLSFRSKGPRFLSATTRLRPGLRPILCGLELHAFSLCLFHASYFPVSGFTLDCLAFLLLTQFGIFCGFVLPRVLCPGLRGVSPAAPQTLV